MKTIVDQDFTGQDLSGKNFRFYTFIRCNFAKANLADADLTGVVFHLPFFYWTDERRAKTTGTQWGKGGFVSCGGYTGCYFDYHETLSPEEIAFARERNMLRDGSDILRLSSDRPEYTLPCEDAQNLCLTPDEIARVTNRVPLLIADAEYEKKWNENWNRFSPEHHEKTYKEMKALWERACEADRQRLKRLN